jgi:hypothetical protein
MKRAAVLFSSLVVVFAFQTAPLLAAFPAAQESSSKSTHSSDTVKAKPKGREEPKPDEGTLTDSMYAERFFLLHYTVPPGWVVKTPEMRQGLPGQENAILLLAAFEKAAPSPGTINSSVDITAESAAASPDIKTPADYMESITELVTSKGFTVLNPPGEISIGGVSFLRSDFQKQEGDLTTYQATMVAMRRGYFLQVTAISGDDEQLTPLLDRVRITAPPTLKKP